MEELRIIVGKNLSNLRKRKGLTQLELAEKFNYTDRAVSKWENGDTLPDLEVLYNLCEFYGVTLDYLTHVDNEEYVKEDLATWNKISITALVVSVAWTLATVIFVISLLKKVEPLWQSFIWAVPLSALIVVLFNKAYFHLRLMYFISWSVFVWGILAASYFSLLNLNIWPIFILGVPAQATLFIWLNIHGMNQK